MAESPQPLVLVSNRQTASGHSYADRTGESYEFPTRYRNQIQPGSPFVYYRSREGLEQPHYFGAGVIGPVQASRTDPTRLECEILDYRPFERAIPFRAASGHYLEVNGARKGYYQPGVRRITEDELTGILTLADSAPPEAEIVAGDVPPVEAQYGTSEASRLVEEYAVKQVVALLRERYGNASVREMPRNNPGYDLRVLFDGKLSRYVEVKGTALAAPVFFLTEGERKFSAQEAHRYLLFVVYNVRRDAGTHDLAEWAGEVTQANWNLKPSQWSGRLPV